MNKKLCIAITFILIAATSAPLLAQNDIWGNWLMYFGTNRLSDKWSIHSELQYRNHTVEPVNIEQLLLRTGANYHLAKNATLTLGYGYINSHVYESEQRAPESKEHRIFQQLILTNKVDRVKFEHRYRVEQRWVNDVFKNRLRYRLMLFIPINNKTITEKTFFVGLYDELFMNTDKVFFDRNRLYGALGYQINKEMQVQLGYLRQSVNDFGKNYLQFAITVNPNFSKED